VRVSNVEKVSGRATVTNSFPVRRHEPEKARVPKMTRRQRFCSKTLPPK
jgi:hypothetical protein